MAFRPPGDLIARESERGARVKRNDGSAVDLKLEDVASLLAIAKVILPKAITIKDANGELRRLTEPSVVEVPIGTAIKLLGGKPRPRLYRDIFDRYAPDDMVEQPYPVSDLDFASSGAYSVYNWELFYHIPLAVAVHLSKNQRYEEAQRWFGLAMPDITYISYESLRLMDKDTKRPRHWKFTAARNGSR